MIALPFNESILRESLFVCFSILSTVISQFKLFAYCIFSLKQIPSIFELSFLCFILISLGNLLVMSVFIGNTVFFFSKLIVAPVACFSFWTYFSTFSTDFWSCKKKFESSAYCEIFNRFSEFGIASPIIVLSLFMFSVVTSPCTTYSGSESGQPCLSPLCVITVSERNPLLIIVDLLPLYSISIKCIYSLENRNFLSKGFSWSICRR